MLTLVSSKDKVTLSYFFTVVGSFNFALIDTDQFVLAELAFHARLVVDRRPTKVVVRHSILGHTLFLGLNLILMVCTDAVAICLV